MVTVKGRQYLKDAKLADVVGAVININWGKQMTEQGKVTKFDPKTSKLSFNKIPCPGPGIVPYRTPPYVSCSTRPFIKLKQGKEQGMAHYFLTQKLELLDQEGEWHF